MDDILVTNIQRFSLHDGPGIRTTVFLKGCTLRCPWCCNPENILSQIQHYEKNGIRGTYGVRYTTDSLYKEIIKDKSFFAGSIEDYGITSPALLMKLPGGITFSGGEALLQISQLEQLLQRLNKEHIHMTVETSLFVRQEALRIAIRYIDLFYVDIKILDSEKCKRHQHGSLNQFLENWSVLLESGKPIVVRVPVIGGYTDGPDNIAAIIDLLKKAKGNIIKVELLKEHNLGIQKYRSLISAGNIIEMPANKGVSDITIHKYKEYMESELNYCIEICKI